MWLCKKQIFTIFACIAMLCMMLQPASAQRIVTPVESNDLPFELQKKDAAKAMADTIATDTVAEKEPVHKAPLFGGALITADLAAPFMNLLGTQYGNYEAAVEFDIYHRFFPVLEVGVGSAWYTPDGNNYTFKCNPSLYGRIGVNYNFFFNNGSESFFAVGLRYGLTSFSYNWENITFNDSYWDDEVVANTPQEQAFAHWGEVVIALRVQIYKNFFMGWSGRFRLLAGCDSSQYGDPYFIPGFGPKETAFGFTYTVGYNIPIKKKEKEKEIVAL